MSSSYRTILILCDADECDRSYLHDLARDSNFRLVIGRTDSPIVSLCKSQNIDVIVWDLSESEGDPIESLHQFQPQLSASQRPWVVIGGDQVEVAVGCLQAGAADYLVKTRLTPERLRLALKTESALHQSEARYRVLFKTMEDGFCVIEVIFDAEKTPVDYRFVELNPAFERHTGLREAAGKTARQLLPELEEHWFQIYGSVALTGEPVRFENGSEAMNRWFEVYAFRIEQPEDRKVAVLFREISDRKTLETQQERLLKQEQKAREAAERANRIKDDFLAILSHELRSPLNPILGWSRLLQTHSLNAEKTALALATIERNAKLQTQLVDDLLDVAKILRGKLTLNRAPVNLSEMIESAIETVRAFAQMHAVSLYMDIQSMGPVCGDEARLQQVIWNLLSNAIKFTPRGGRVDIYLEQVDHHAQIRIQDTGKGINPTFLPHIFDSFRQEDASITRQHGGLGLGLAIVRHLVETQGGTIAAESAGEGQGATFTVTFPLFNQENNSAIAAQNAPENFDLTGLRILTVDDNSDACELMQILLAQYGANVMTAASATEALALLEVFQPDVLVSDLGMPEMDGYALIEQIRTFSPERCGQIPAIALTAYARETDIQRALACGYQKHLIKPLDVDHLIQAVAALMANPPISRP